MQILLKNEQIKITTYKVKLLVDLLGLNKIRNVCKLKISLLLKSNTQC